jgi:hypothetical protein
MIWDDAPAANEMLYWDSWDMRKYVHPSLALKENDAAHTLVEDGDRYMFARDVGDHIIEDQPEGAYIYQIEKGQALRILRALLN